MKISTIFARLIRKVLPPFLAFSDLFRQEAQFSASISVEYFP